MKESSRLLTAALSLTLGLCAHSSAAESLQPVALTCEYLKNPVGVDVIQPRLSWKLKSDIRGQKQTAYHVLVASSRNQLEKDVGDLWDTGKVESDQSIHVEYDGRPMKSRMQCFWKVRVWDKDGNLCGWSGPASWTTGMLNPEDWQAKWITMKVAKGLAHPWLRRTFELKSDITRAEVYVNTPSHYELYINGRRVGLDVLAPAHANHKKRILYNVYDVSSYLGKGRNCIALWMGPGWYQPRYGNPDKAPILRLQLDVHSTEGVFTLGTDSQWRVADSCISQVGRWEWNNMGGERWDAGKYIEAWNQVTFDDSRWASAAETSTRAQIDNSWQAMPGSRVRRPIKPERIYPHGDRWVIDFGTTLTGWMRLRMSDLDPGQKITIEYADLDATRKHLAFQKNNTGFQTHNQKDIYVAGNRKQGVFCSKFNQHAFRYAVIAGLSRAPSLEDAEAMTVESDLEKAGEFSCSNELFNQIHQVTLRTSHSQNPCGALGGGEAREKLGYGDGGSFLSGFLYNLQSDAFFQKWLRDWCDGQQPDGFLGHTAPEYYAAGGGPSWGGEASELVRRLYVYYGDRRAVADTYATLKKYLDHLESKTHDDILRYFNPYKPGKFYKWYFLGDWTPPGAGPDRHGFVFESALQREFFNNCYRILLWDHLASYADALDDKAEARRCRKRLAELRPLVHKTYYDPKKKTYKANRQAYLTIALLAQVVPPELRPAILKQLEDDIVIAKQGHLDTGLLGTFMLLDLLTKENRNDLVALMMNQTTFPGWGFLIKERNVTTWPETWSGWGSQIIQVVGTPGAWFYEGLAGILPDPENPGFKHFTLRPGIVKSADWVKCSYQSPYGEIVSNWRLENGSFLWDISVPVNSTATVYLPTINPKSIKESSKSLSETTGVTFSRMADGRAVLTVVSGSYSFISKYNQDKPKPNKAGHQGQALNINFRMD